MVLGAFSLMIFQGQDRLVLYLNAPTAVDIKVRMRGNGGIHEGAGISPANYDPIRIFSCILDFTNA